MRCSHRGLLSALNQCLWISTRIQSIQHRKDDDALRWKSLLWRRYLWSVQIPSTIKWCHNLVSSVAFSAGLIENTLEHVSICDSLASLSNRLKRWGINGSHIRCQSESFRVRCTVYTCTTLAIYEEGNKTQIYFVIVVFGDRVYCSKVHIVHHVTLKTRPSLFSFCGEGGVTGGNLPISQVRQTRDVLFSGLISKLKLSF